MTFQQVVIWAKAMGRTAFENGIMCAPVLDGDFMKIALISDNVAPVLRAWIAGWTQANLEAPL